MRACCNTTPSQLRHLGTLVLNKSLLGAWTRATPIAGAAASSTPSFASSRKRSPASWVPWFPLGLGTRPQLAANLRTGRPGAAPADDEGAGHLCLPGSSLRQGRPSDGRPCHRLGGLPRAHFPILGGNIFQGASPETVLGFCEALSAFRFRGEGMPYEKLTRTRLQLGSEARATCTVRWRPLDGRPRFLASHGRLPRADFWAPPSFHRAAVSLQSLPVSCCLSWCVRIGGGAVGGRVRGPRPEAGRRPPQQRPGGCSRV